MARFHNRFLLGLSEIEEVFTVVGFREFVEFIARIFPATTLFVAMEEAQGFFSAVYVFETELSNPLRNTKPPTRLRCIK